MDINEVNQVTSFRDRVSVMYDEGIAHVRLSRPNQRNAIDAAMFAAISDAIEAVAQSGAGAVVLAGHGDAFCAGLDRSNFEDMIKGKAPSGIPQNLAKRTHGQANLPQHCAIGWRYLPMPVIAAIHGAALGGGLQVALGADMRIVSPTCRLSLMEVRWGLVPDMGAFALLPSLVRDDVLRDLVLSGRIIDGVEAVALGLATAVSDDPLMEATARARIIANASPSAVRAAKRLANGALGDLTQVLTSEALEQQALVGGPDQMLAVLKQQDASARPSSST